MLPDEVATERPVEVEAVPERTAVPDEERTAVPVEELRVTGRTALVLRAAEVRIASVRDAETREAPELAVRVTVPARLVLLTRVPSPEARRPAPPVTWLRGDQTEGSW